MQTFSAIPQTPTEKMDMSLFFRMHFRVHFQVCFRVQKKAIELGPGSAKLPAHTTFRTCFCCDRYYLRQVCFLSLNTGCIWRENNFGRETHPNELRRVTDGTCGSRERGKRRRPRTAARRRALDPRRRRRRRRQHLLLQRARRNTTTTDSMQRMSIE